MTNEAIASDSATITLRLAQPADIPALKELIPLSVRALSAQHYSPQQIESAIRFVFGVDTQLIHDGTYFVAESADRIVACGGWSKRRTLYGGDQAKDTEDPLLDARVEAARVRAFFVHPDWARRGIGSRILHACYDAAAWAGFTRLELMSTLPGQPLYERLGFVPVERVEATLPDGVAIGFVHMARDIAG